MSAPDQPNLDNLVNIHKELQAHEAQRSKELQEQQEAAALAEELRSKDVTGAPLRRFFNDYEISLCHQFLEKIRNQSSQTQGRYPLRIKKILRHERMHRYEESRGQQIPRGILGRILGLPPKIWTPPPKEILNTNGYMIGIAAPDAGAVTPGIDSILSKQIPGRPAEGIPADPVLLAASSLGKLIGAIGPNKYSSQRFKPVYLCDDELLRTVRGSSIPEDLSYFFAGREISYTRTVYQYKDSYDARETVFVHMELPDLLATTAIILENTTTPPDLER